MKKILTSFIILTLLLSCINVSFVDTISTKVTTKFYKEGTTNLTAGTYLSSDNHKVTVASDGTVTYDDLYTLTATLNSAGNKVSGKVGTNNKTLTLYEVNDSTFISGANVSYSDGTNTINIYNHTAFVREKTPTPVTNGIIEVYSSGKKTGAYNDLQSAVDAAKTGDTVKITKSFKPTSGAYISNKEITIDGNNSTIDKTAYALSLFVVEEGTKATIKNMVIDGGSKHEIDWTLSTPKLVDGSTDTDLAQLMSVVVSKGNVTIDNLDAKNLNAGSSDVIPTVIKIQLGTAKIKNCDMHHIYGSSRGSSINIGTEFRTVQDKYLVDSVTIDNCTFTENFARGGWGGCVSVSNTTEVKFMNSKFIKNMSNGYTAGAGALYFDRNDCTPADKFNLPFIQAYIDNCVFEENYSGNDGFAIQNESAEMYITNSRFAKNVGLAGNSSVGTVSCMTYREKVYKQVIKNCVFDGNVGAASVFGDHGSLVDLDMSDCTIKNNEGSISVLLYAGDADFNNCTFENEKASTAVLDVRPYANVNTDPLYKPPVININNTTFKNNVTPADVLMRKYQNNDSLNAATVTIKGETTADVHIWDNNNLTVEGNLNGNIETDAKTSKDNIVIKEDAIVTGDINTAPKTAVIVTINYEYEDNNKTNAYIYLEPGKAYTDKDLYNMHFIGKDDYKLEYYTDSSYTTPWTYQTTTKITLYAKWVEHTHKSDKVFILHENAIYEQCECGYNMNELSLHEPKNLHYNKQQKPVEVLNGTSIKSSDYKITYEVLQKSGTYVELDGIPTDLGIYKATLTYNGMSISQEYEIIENPNTADINTYLLISIALVLIIGLIRYGKEKRLF